MNTPRTKPLKRYGPPTSINTPHGGYKSGVWSDKHAMLLGQLAAQWPHVEEAMIDILHELLGGSGGLPTRQIFRSIPNNAAREKLMTALLELGEVNQKKDVTYEGIISRFHGLN